MVALNPIALSGFLAQFALMGLEIDEWVIENPNRSAPPADGSNSDESDQSIKSDSASHEDNHVLQHPTEIQADEDDKDDEKRDKNKSIPSKKTNLRNRKPTNPNLDIVR